MAGAGAKGFAKREHEPITLVCLVVFMLASVIVIGTWVSDQITGESSETVQYGDSVTVEYTGSLYGFYDQGTDTMVPVIFDTNVKSVGTNSNYVFTSTFSSTYSTTTLTLGDGKFLAAFEDAKTFKDGPTVIIFDTVKGKGVSFMENNAGFHGKACNKEEYEKAVKELRERI